MMLNDARFAGAQSKSPQGAGAPVAPQPGQDETSKMFMTLLLAQIQNQNPLEPADPAQFVNQLVQMNQLQSTQNMLSELGAHGLLLRELQGLSLSGLVGSQAMVTVDAMDLSGDAVSGRLTLTGAEKDVTLVLTGEDGQRHEVALGERAEGESAFSVDPKALGLPEGRYSVEVKTASGKKAMLEVEAKIESVRLPIGGGEPLVRLAGIGEFPASYVTQLLGKPAAARAA